MDIADNIKQLAKELQRHRGLFDSADAAFLAWRNPNGEVWHVIAGRMTGLLSEDVPHVIRCVRAENWLAFRALISAEQFLWICTHLEPGFEIRRQLLASLPVDLVFGGRASDEFAVSAPQTQQRTSSVRLPTGMVPHLCCRLRDTPVLGVPGFQNLRRQVETGKDFYSLEAMCADLMLREEVCDGTSQRFCSIELEIPIRLSAAWRPNGVAVEGSAPECIDADELLVKYLSRPSNEQGNLDLTRKPASRNSIIVAGEHTFSQRADEVDLRFLYGGLEIGCEYLRRDNIGQIGVGPRDRWDLAQPVHERIAPSSTGSLSGAVLGERWRLLQPIGAGGEGTVYRAEHTIVGHLAAVKVLHSGVEPTKTDVERFRRQAAAIRVVKHEGLITVLDGGYDHESALLFQAMELLDGETLADCDYDSYGEHLKATLPAMRELHYHSVVHRDLKPENIFVLRDGSTRLLDLGLIMMVGDARLTQTGERIGTVAFASPEQLRDPHNVTPASDIWSCGVILFQGLTHSLPFDGGNEVATITKILHDDFEFSVAIESRSPDLVELISCCLSKDPDTRPDADELLSALDAITGKEDG